MVRQRAYYARGSIRRIPRTCLIVYPLVACTAASLPHQIGPTAAPPVNTMHPYIVHIARRHIVSRRRAVKIRKNTAYYGRDMWPSSVYDPYAKSEAAGETPVLKTQKMRDNRFPVLEIPLYRACLLQIIGPNPAVHSRSTVVKMKIYPVIPVIRGNKTAAKTEGGSAESSNLLTNEKT